MISKFYDLRNKEMICVKDGLKIGFVDDMEIDTQNFKVISLIAYGGSKFFGLFGKYEDIKINYEDVEVIGEDIILVKNYNNVVDSRRKNKGFFNKLFD